MAVSVDVTCGRGDAAAPGAFVDSATYGLGLALYSLLCRHVEPFFPDGSQFDRVRNPGVGLPVTLGRSLADIEHGLPAILAASGRHATIVFLDEDAWLDRQAVGAALDRLVAATRATDGRCLVLPIVLHEAWATSPGEIATANLASTPEPLLVSHLRAHVLAHLGAWLARGRAPGQPERPLSILVRRSHRAAAGEAVHRALAVAVEGLGLASRCEVPDLDPDASLADLGPSADHTVVVAVEGEAGADPLWHDRDAVDACRQRLMVVTLQASGVDVDREDLRGPIAWRESRAAQVIERCLAAWVHHLFFQTAVPVWLEQARVRAPHCIVSRPPTLADFALGALPGGRDTVIVYPDPPVSHEAAKILVGQQPQVRLVTPTTLFAGNLRSDDPAPPLTRRAIALSMAVGPHAPRALAGVTAHGFNELHLRDAIAQLTLVLVRSGARLGYGGRLDRRGVTAFLAETIALHNRLGAGTVVRPLLFGRDDEAPSGLDVEVVPCKPVVPPGSGRADVAVTYSTKRVAMAARCDARVAFGGMTRLYVGRFPGVLEECWHMLKAGKPVYVIGAFGGGAELVAQALLGTLPPGWAVDEEARLHREQPEMIADYHDRWIASGEGVGPASLEELVGDLYEWGTRLRQGPDADDDPWTNGLTLRENRQLFASRDLQEITTLVMRGLTSALPALPRSGEGPALRAFHGNLAEVERADAYAVPLVDDLPMDGACAVLDRRLGGAVARALAADPRSPVVSVPVPSEWTRLAGRWVHVVRLGSVDEVARAGREAVRRGCDALVRALNETRVAHLAVVPFATTLGLNVATSFEAMREVLATTSGILSLTFCEQQPGRYRDLEGALRNSKGSAVVLAPRLPAVEPSASGPAPLVVSVSWQEQTIKLRELAPHDDATPTVHERLVELSGDQVAFLQRLYRGDDGQTPRDLVAIGRELAAVFRPLGDTLGKDPGRCLDLILDDASSTIPWEALRFADEGSDHVPARNGGVRRRLVVRAVAGPPVRRIGPGQRLSVLLVIDPTSNTPGAHEEGEAIREAFTRHRATIDAFVLEGGEATVDRLLDLLRKRTWDVLHYAGHARFAPGDPEGSGLKLGDRRLTAAMVTAEPPWPPLVVINACRSAAVAGGDAASWATHGPSLVRNILLAGVRTYIGTSWPVTKGITSRFTPALYDTLVKGETIGDAMRAARRELGHDQACYALYGDLDLRF